jgi:hypothetical protein
MSGYQVWEVDMRDGKLCACAWLLTFSLSKLHGGRHLPTKPFSTPSTNQGAFIRESALYMCILHTSLGGGVCVRENLEIVTYCD